MWRARVERLGVSFIAWLDARLREATRPATAVGIGRIADLRRTPDELRAENALLRQQLIVAMRAVKRPKLDQGDRAALVWLARACRTWRTALLLVKPETVLRWHREGYRLYWKRKSRPRSKPRTIDPRFIALIQRTARENRLWGAERIRGELRKLGISVAKRTIQKYMHLVRPPRPRGQSWATFVRNHALDTWACDFIETYDALFRGLYAFIVIELGSRRIVHVGVTRHPTSAWVAQQLREITPYGEGPRFLIRDNDGKFGSEFDEVARGAEIDVKLTPIRAPDANAFCERLVRSVRRECLDHVLVLGEKHLRRVLTEYVRYYNEARPHQGNEQRVPDRPERPSRPAMRVSGRPFLGGLHHDYLPGFAGG